MFKKLLRAFTKSGLIPAPMHGPLPTNDVLKNINALYTNDSGGPDICYRAALWAAFAAQSITRKTYTTVERINNFEKKYLDFMGITEATSSTSFLEKNIEESGFLNFRDDKNPERHMVHVAYLHRDANGNLTLMHLNHIPLDLAITTADGKLKKVSTLNIYDFCDGGITGLKNFIQDKHSFHFTPASVLNANVH